MGNKRSNGKVQLSLAASVAEQRAAKDAAQAEDAAAMAALVARPAEATEADYKSACERVKRARSALLHCR